MNPEHTGDENFIVLLNLHTRQREENLIKLLNFYMMKIQLVKSTHTNINRFWKKKKRKENCVGIGGALFMYL